MSRRTAAAGGSRARGFTLLEVLVALTILGLLTVLVYGGLRVGLKSWEAVERRSAESAAERVARGLVARQVAALVPVRWDANLPPRIAFEGDAQGFRFLGPLAHAERGGGLYLIEIQARREDEGLGLAVGYQLRDPEPRRLAGTGARIERILGARLRRLEFEYYGSPDGRSPARWHRLWADESRAFPQQLRLRGTDQAGREWPELRLRLRAAPPAAG